MITNVLCGKIYLKDYNNLLVISGKGKIHIIEVPYLKNDPLKTKITLMPIYSQHIPANTKTGILIDFDGDGLDEVVIGLTDRIVRSFKWVFDAQVKNDLQISTQNLKGKFIAYHKWELIKQIGNLSYDFNTGFLGKIEDKYKTLRLLCSQPKNSYVILPTQEQLNNDNLEYFSNFQHPDISPNNNMPVEYITITPSQPQESSNSSTEICGSLIINLQDVKHSYSALITIDGKLYVLLKDSVVYSLNLKDSLFGLGKLNLLDRDHDQFIFSSWQGNTYILDPPNNITVHQFNQDVRAFSFGYYSFRDSKKLPCLIYITLDNIGYLTYD
ncbi:KICSTOR complex protein ITFG2-like isoform X2 [Gordionus sp. m RMFG-2023]